ncbi:MAG: 4Fe-4S dicluster domain-containing protein [Gammaproteobacteria bacterium]|nr:MAG: 4Fe-4S dicluster domain-containing protein [Gammaproteobacteria bacterium]
MSEIVNQNTDQSKRSFIKKAVAGSAVVTIAPGVVLFNIANASRDPASAVTNDVRWGMLIDADKCADGCSACVDACHEENGVHQLGRPATDAQWIRKVHLRDKQTGKEYGIPMLCQHCESPPCVDVCPTGASFKRADGIVLVDKHICIGCRYCMMACPYKARSFIHEDVTDQKPHAPRGKGTVESCTFCVHRVDDGGRTPACVEACAKENHRAMVFGDLKDPDSELSQELRKYPSRQLREDLGLNQGVRYRNI